MTQIGKLVFLPAKELKEGDKVILNEFEYIIVKEYSKPEGHNELSLKDACIMPAELFQFHVEWEESIVTIKNDGFYIDKPVFKSLPLSFSQYAMALEIGEGAEVEYEMKTDPTIYHGEIKAGVIGRDKYALIKPKGEPKEESWEDVFNKFIKEENYRITMLEWLEDNYNAPTPKDNGK